MAPETLMERSYDLKRARTGHTAAPKRVLSRVRAARQRETVKARLKRLFPAGPSLKGLFPGMLP